MRFGTPDEAERAFYDAFNRGSVEAMREVWLDDDSTVCIHPQSRPLTGGDAVHGSWEQILQGPGQLGHELLTRCQGPMLAVHTGIESAATGDEIVELAVTNVFQLTQLGWRMLAHHASAAPAAAAPSFH